MSPTSRTRGFTLVEMMVSLTMFVLVMGLALNTLVASNAVRQAATAKLDVFQTGRSVLELIASDLKNATLRTKDTAIDPLIIQQVKTIPNANQAANAASGIMTNVGNTNPPNTRGRLTLNDWPPPREFASMFQADPDDPRVYRGNGLDDDGDGRTDEEAYDGLDNDGDGEANSPTRLLFGQNARIADGIDNNNNGLIDEGIDEDIFYPRDMLNFVMATDPIQNSDIMEIGYAIDHNNARDLIRRAAYSTPPQNSAFSFQSSEVDGVYPIALLYNPAIGQFPLAPLYRQGSDALRIPWFDPEVPTNPQTLDARAVNSAFPLQVYGQYQYQVEPVALNILGFDCRAYYHDYALAEENERRNTSSAFTATGINVNTTDPTLNGFNPYSFPAYSWDSSIENYAQITYAGNLPPQIRVCPNGADDMAVIQGSNKFRSFTSNPDRIEAYMAKSDGLPRMIEVTLFVEDRFGYVDEPVRMTTRVFLPYVTGDE